MRQQAVDKRHVALIIAAVQVRVERADILLAHALDDEYNHVLVRVAQFIHYRMKVDRAIGGLHLLIGHIIGGDKCFLAEATDHRERRVQHYRRLNRAIDILVSVADGDGASARRDTAADAHDGQRNHYQQGNSLRDIILRTKTVHLEPWLGIASPQDQHQRGKCKHQIPVVHKFGQQDGRDVALVGKLSEHGHRRTATRILEIDGIHQIAGDGNSVGHDKQPLEPLVEALPLLEMQRQQHEHQIDTIDIKQR